MSFLFKRNKHNNAKDGLGLGVRAPASSPGDYTGRKLRKNMRRHNSSCRPVVSVSSSAMSRSRSVETTTAVSGAEASSGPNGNRVAGMADVVLDPLQYTELLLQASAVRDRQQEQDSGYTNAAELKVPPPTPLRRHSTRRELQLRQSRAHQSQTQSQSQVPRSVENCNIVDAIVEGVTYDAILASTVNRTFNGRGGFMVEEEEEVRAPPPETRVPPNSPAVSVRLRRNAGGDNGFGSLVGVTMAIMESRVPVV